MEKFNRDAERDLLKNENSILRNKIFELAEEAYKSVARNNRIDEESVFKDGNCVSVSQEIASRMKNVAQSSQVYEYPGGWVVTEHDYVNAVIDGEEWVVDGTWQQFLKKELQSKEKYPPVLLVKKTAEDIQAELDRMGISNDDFGDSIRETLIKMMKKKFSDLYLEARPV